MKETFILLITWAPTIVFALFLILNLFDGARRGFSKSVKLFITFVLSVIVAIGFYLLVNDRFDTLIVESINKTLPVVKSILVNFMDTSSIPSNTTEVLNKIFERTYGAVSDHAKFSEYLEQILASTNYFSEASQGLSLAEATKLLYSLSMLIVHIVLVALCILVFLLAKAVLYIFYLIFFKEGRRKKRINKKHQAGKIDHPYKKKALLGLVVGLVRGLAVGLFFVSIFGTISVLVPKNSEEEIKDESHLNSNARTYRDLYTAVCNWTDQGVTSVLSNIKNKENVPYYLIISDKILSTQYTYEENGETKTITLTLSTDLAPLTKSVSKAAYVFLMYGYDINKSYTNQEMIDFICSDTQIEGLTLQDRIDDILEKQEIGEYTSYLMDGLVRTYVSNVCQNVSGTETDEYKNLELSNKLLYQLFIGENSIKTSDILNGENLKAAFNTFVAIETHQDEINALSKVFESADTTVNSSQKLLFGINKTALSTEVKESKNIFDLINDELKSLTFYSDSRFQRCVSDILVTVLNENYEGLDFTSVVTDQTLYDVSWTESLDVVFDVLADITDLIIDKNFTTVDELSDYLMSELKDKDSKTVVDIKNLINSSAGSILLNSKAFNKMVSDSLTEMFKEILPDAEITIIETNYAAYTKEDGTNVSGELEKVIDSLGTVLSNIYSISKDSTLSDDDKTNNMIKVLAHDASLRELITDGDNHSIFIHNILSSVISNVSLSDNKETIYIPEGSVFSVTYLNQTCEIIDSHEFTNMLDFLSELTDKYTLSDFDNKDKYVDLIFDLAQYVSNSNIIKANIAKTIYDFKDSANLSFTTSLDLSAENIDKNMANWIDEGAEVDKLIDIITFEDTDGNNQKALIKDIINGNGDYSKYLVTIINSLDTFGEVLFTSDMINATVTDYLEKEDAVYLPKSSYNSGLETLKISEIKSMCSFVKDALNVTSETESIDFTSLDSISLEKYTDNLDGLLALFDSDIVCATLGYNIIKNSNNDTSELVVPSSLIFTKDDESNLTKWIGNEGETKKLASSVYHLGLLASVGGSALSIDEDKLLTLDNSLISTVFASDIFNATGADYFLNHRPESLAVKSEYIVDKENIINSYETTPLTANKEVEKLIIAVKSLGTSLAQSNISVELINKMNDKDDNNKSSLDYIIESDILYYGLSDYIIKSNELKVSKSAIDTVDSYNYVESTELHNFVNGVISLNISSDLAEFDANKLLSSDVDTMLKSSIIWYTLSNKLLQLDGIDILFNSIEVKNDDEIFVEKNEVTNFTTAIKSITDDLDTIDVTIEKLVENVDTLTNSNIIRTSITQKVLESNDIVVKRSDEIVYAQEFDKYNEEGNTNNGLYTLTKDEITNFVNAVNTIYGTSPTYEVDYSSIQFESIDESILDSTVILLGLQSKIDDAITLYNSIPGNNFDDSSYDIYEYTIYHHDTKTEEAKTLHTKECVEALKALY